ncbi:hypothetical protein N431DRAFT_365026 [Stipitochalara longipes BDJ]|nr:hypothetical protein N431DRAFT_365026 [Stipitochalara longipes BDJ]
MLRRSHKKSRAGCSSCKKRHIKCDEHRPVCVNCSTAGMQCSFTLSTQAIETASRDEPMTTKSPESGPKSPPPSSSSSCIDPTLVPAEPYVNATHLELFYFIVDGADWRSGGDHLRASRPHVVKYAFTYPFLLNQLLAVSALHLSIRRPAQRSFYREEAARLQSHGLRYFNETLKDLNHQNIIPAFLFSAVQGMATFFETFHDPSVEARDWTTFFERIVQSFRLLQGVRAIVYPWWQFLLTSEIRDILDDTQEDAILCQNFSDEVVDRFETMRVHISRSPELDQNQARVCDKAMEELIFVYKSAFMNGEPSTEDQGAAKHATRWFLLAPPPYTELLVQRKPEALVILGQFSIILHKLRACWNVGDAAHKLLLVVDAHLEESWRATLSWPKSFIEGDLIK